MITDIKHHSCSRCGSFNLRKNGRSVEGRPKYHCKDCGKYGTISDVAQERHKHYEQAVAAHIFEIH